MTDDQFYRRTNLESLAAVSSYGDRQDFHTMRAYLEYHMNSDVTGAEITLALYDAGISTRRISAQK